MEILQKSMLRYSDVIEKCSTALRSGAHVSQILVVDLFFRERKRWSMDLSDGAKRGM